MKAQAILCAALAGTFGFSSLAIAQDGGRRGDREQRAEQRELRQDRREARQEQREDRREFRAERRDDRRDRQAQRVDRAWDRGYDAAVQQPRHVYQQPSYVYSQPAYRSHVLRYHRGGYLPHEYRNHGYHVSNWNAYPGLYAPPYGHQWVQVGSDFLLVAIATGLIANLLTQ